MKTATERKQEQRAREKKLGLVRLELSGLTVQQRVQIRDYADMLLGRGK